MNKADIINKIAVAHNIPASRAELIMDIVLEKIAEKLKKDGEVNIENFGSFSVRIKSQHPGSFSETTIFPRKYVYFDPDKKFLDIVNITQ